MTDPTPEQIALDEACAKIHALIVTTAHHQHALTFNSKESAVAALTRFEAALNGNKEARMFRINSAEGVSTFDLFAVTAVRVVNEVAQLRTLAPWVLWKRRAAI